MSFSRKRWWRIVIKPSVSFGSCRHFQTWRLESNNYRQYDHFIKKVCNSGVLESLWELPTHQCREGRASCENFKHCIRHTWKLKNSSCSIYSASKRAFPNTQLGRAWQLSEESWFLCRLFRIVELEFQISNIHQSILENLCFSAKSSEEVLAVLWRPYTVA